MTDRIRKATEIIRLATAVLAALGAGITLARRIREEKNQAASELADQVVNHLVHAERAAATIGEALDGHAARFAAATFDPAAHREQAGRTD